MARTKYLSNEWRKSYLPSLRFTSIPYPLPPRPPTPRRPPTVRKNPGLFPPHILDPWSAGLPMDTPMYERWAALIPTPPAPNPVPRTELLQSWPLKSLTSADYFGISC
jgi:hypothetical protein